MAFRRIGSLIAGAVPVAPPKDNQPFRAVDNEAVVAGRVYKTGAGGRMTAASGTDNGALLIAVEDVPADAAGAVFRGEYIVPGQIYEADIAGTTNTFAGKTGARLDATGEGVADSEESDGPLTILSVDADNGTAKVVFRKSATAG